MFATNQVSSEFGEGEDAQQQEFGAPPTMVVQGRVDVVSTCPSRGNQVDGLPRATSAFVGSIPFPGRISLVCTVFGHDPVTRQILVFSTFFEF